MIIVLDHVHVFYTYNHIRPRFENAVYTWCVRKVMRLVPYFFIWHLPINEHYPPQNISLGKPHTAGNIAPTPGSSAGILNVEVQSAGLSRPFGCCPQFQNDVWGRIGVLGKGRIHTDSGDYGGCWTFSFVFDVQVSKERGSSCTLSRPSKNALCHLKTCVLDTACCP